MILIWETTKEKVLNLQFKGAATSKAVKNCKKKKLLHINILEPFTNKGKVKKKSLSQLF